MFFRSEPRIKQGKKVIENVYYFAESGMLDCNQYIIKNSTNDELSLFDAGNGLSLNGLIEGLKQHDLDFSNVTKVYITHEHVDHVIGLYRICKMLENDLKIYAYGETVKILQEGMVDKIFPGSLGIGPEIFNIEVVPLDVQELENSCRIGQFEFKILHTPGHSPSSICYYEPTQKILIPGDLVFIGGSFGRYDFPGGSLPKLIESISRVNDLDVEYLLPGHMGISKEGNNDIKMSFRMVKSIGSYY
jgi:glyoxylase-like metal-dependent hydrolase (beta-lactamase superfamily II)